VNGAWLAGLVLVHAVLAAWVQCWRGALSWLAQVSQPVFTEKPTARPSAVRPHGSCRAPTDHIRRRYPYAEDDLQDYLQGLRQATLMASASKEAIST
jgi:hypothetical protein